MIRPPKPQPFQPYPRPPFKRLPRSKYVTIAAGFHCIEGIVLCADTQETVDNYIKRNVPKIAVRPQWTDDKSIPRVVFAGAGDGDLIDSLVGKMWGVIQHRSYLVLALELMLERTRRPR